MKKFSIFAAVCIAAFSSCKTSKLVGYADDVYSVPTEERALARQAEEEKQKQDLLAKQKLEQEQAAQRARDEANPYYKDPVYSADDYYDYQYASRLNRFKNPVYGAGYYDPYYTNTYTYNQNPQMYGTSIYNGCNVGTVSYGAGYYAGYPGYCGAYPSMISTYGTSFNNYGYSYGNYAGMGYCGGGYMGYGYPSSYNYYNSMYYGGMGYPGYGYNNYYYSPYGYGNYGGWNIVNWGYVNGLDPNSVSSNVQYAVRGGETNGSSGRAGQNNGMIRNEESASRAYFESVDARQSAMPRFSAVEARSRNSGPDTQGESRSRMTQQGWNDNNPVFNQGNSAGMNPRSNNTRVETNTGDDQQGNPQETRRNSRITQLESDKASMGQENSANRSSGGSWNFGGSGGGMGGGSSSPRSSGGDGGGHRPR